MMIVSCIVSRFEVGVIDKNGILPQLLQGFHNQIPGRLDVLSAGGKRNRKTPRICQAFFVLWIWLAVNDGADVAGYL